MSSVEQIREYSRSTADDLQHLQKYLIDTAEQKRALHPQWAKLEGITSIEYTKGENKQVVAQSDTQELKRVESEGYKLDRIYHKGQFPFTPVEAIIMKALNLMPEDFVDPRLKNNGYTYALDIIADIQDETTAHTKILNALSTGLHSIFRMEYVINAYFNETQEFIQLADTIRAFRQSFASVGWEINVPIELLTTTISDTQRQVGEHIINIGDNSVKLCPIGINPALRYIPSVYQIINARAEEVNAIDKEEREMLDKEYQRLNGTFGSNQRMHVLKEKRDKLSHSFFVDVTNCQLSSPKHFHGGLKLLAGVRIYELDDWVPILSFPTIYSK